MSTAFSRTLRSLQAESFARLAAGLLIAACLAGAWASWSVLAHVTLYELSSSARIEVEQAATPLQSPLAGRVLTVHLPIGHEIEAGDILLELDSKTEQIELSQESARLAALGPQIRALREQAVAEEEARGQEKTAGRAAAEQSLAGVREAEAPARFADNDEDRLRQLRAEGLIPERDYQRSKAEMQRAHAAADSQRLAVNRLEQEQQTRQSDRLARLKSLATEIARVETQIPALEVSIARLKYEIDRRHVRAPVSGRLGEAAVLRPGAMIREGERLAVIVPSSRLAVIAQFAPPAALGRIRPGQTARLRLDGFPWAQYGIVTATVTRVAGEVRDGTVRVELAVDRSAPAIPLQHGLPGTVEVEVERATPASLILRNAGRVFAAPRAVFAATASEAAQ